VKVFAAVRDEPGNVSVKTIGQEAFKLGAIRAVGLPTTCSPMSRRTCWRARVAAEAPSHLRSHPHTRTGRNFGLARGWLRGLAGSVTRSTVPWRRALGGAAPSARGRERRPGINRDSCPCFRSPETSSARPGSPLVPP
jgi:hypothetical protein